jgi:hypothetical protein
MGHAIFDLTPMRAAITQTLGPDRTAVHSYYQIGIARPLPDRGLS